MEGRLLAQGFQSLAIIVGFKDEQRFSHTGRGSVTVFHVDDRIAEKGADFRPGTDPVIDNDGEHLIDADFKAHGFHGFFSFFKVGGQNPEYTFFFV